MARFVMANRRAGKFREPLKRASRASLDLTYAERLEANVNVIGDTAPDNEEARRVVIFDADPREVASKSANLPPDVMIEPELLRYPSSAQLFASPWLPFSTTFPFPACSAGEGASLTLTLQGNGQPLIDAGVTLYLRAAQGRSISQQETSSAKGQVRFDFSRFWIPTAAVILPSGGFWSFVVRGPSNEAIINIPPLPADGPLAWWHKIMNIQQHDLKRGEGIRVGVIDTGVGPHDYLKEAKTVGAFIEGRLYPNTADIDIHGTHVCGIIGARPAANTTHYVGIAPGADLYCARVFPPGQGANQGDIANAIEALSTQYHVDLINLSLGSENKSEIEQDAITAALEAGTLCLCAAGNSAGPVQYPAALPEAVAVSALGLEGWGPEGTLAAMHYPLERSHFGSEGLYLANFSCFGNEISCCAPGVGIISTVPEGPEVPSSYAVLDGTSMACPVATGALSVLLAGQQDYIGLPRDIWRAEQARSILRNSCKDVGLAANLVGRGLPAV